MRSAWRLFVDGCEPRDCSSRGLETCLTPTAGSAGDYAVEVETILKDLAGNNLLKVFDVDIAAPPRDAAADEQISLPFTVGPR